MDTNDARQHDIREALTGGFSIHEGKPEARRLAESILRAGESTSSDPRDRWQRVKQNKLRSIYRVETDTGAVFVKAHVRSGAVQRLKSWLLGDPAQREFEASRYASIHHIPCVQVFAAGKFRADVPFASASFSYAIDNAIPLSSIFQHVTQANSIRERSNLITAVARLVAAAHDGRFLHADEHPGNILVIRTEAGSFKCCYVDLYGADCNREVGIKQAAGSIASLGQWFRDRASRSVQLSFVKQYARQRKYPQTAAFLRRFLTEIASASHRHRQALYRKRDRRIGKSNAHFRRCDLPNGWRAWITLRFRNQAELTGVAPPAWTTDQPPTELLEAFGVHPSVDTGDSLTDGADAATQFSLTRWQGLMWRLFGSPLRRAHESGCRALNRDLPTELPTGCIEQHRGAIVRCAKKRVTRPPQCMPLTTLLEKLPASQQRRLLERVGWLLARTFDRDLVISNMGPQRIEVTCHKGENVPLWVGIVVRPTRGQLSTNVRNWMLTQMAIEARRSGSGGIHRMARGLRACVHRGNPADRWQDIWRQVQESVAHSSEDPS